MIILMAGLPGTGKSTLARALVARGGGRILSKDEFRHAIFAPDEIEYSSRQDDFCVQMMLETCGYLLSRDSELKLFIDGRPFSRRYQIENVLNHAAGLHQSWRILECVCSEATARARLNDDAVASSHPAGNRDFELYLKVKEQFETINHAKAVIDTDQPFDMCVRQGLAALV
jgi:adenylylsulfate kinase